MNKFKKNLNYLKQRNSGMFDFKKNVLNTINELKEKNYTYNNNKKFSLIYLMSILLVLSFFIKGENTTSSLLSEIDRESSGIQKRVINRDINKSKYANGPRWQHYYDRKLRIMDVGPNLTCTTKAVAKDQILLPLSEEFLIPCFGKVCQVAKVSKLRRCVYSK